MADDVLGLNDGVHNGASEKLDPAQTEPQSILATKGGSNVSPTLITIQCSLEITQPQSPPAQAGRAITTYNRLRGVGTEW